LRKKGKYKRAEKFAEKMKEVQGEAKMALAKAQEVLPPCFPLFRC